MNSATPTRHGSEIGHHRPATRLRKVYHPAAEAADPVPRNCGLRPPEAGGARLRLLGPLYRSKREIDIDKGLTGPERAGSTRAASAPRRAGGEARGQRLASGDRLVAPFPAERPCGRQSRC